MFSNLIWDSLKESNVEKQKNTKKLHDDYDNGHVRFTAVRAYIICVYYIKYYYHYFYISREYIIVLIVVRTGAEYIYRSFLYTYYEKTRKKKKNYVAK